MALSAAAAAMTGMAQAPKICPATSANGALDAAEHEWLIGEFDALIEPALDGPQNSAAPHCAESASPCRQTACRKGRKRRANNAARCCLHRVICLRLPKIGAVGITGPSVIFTRQSANRPVDVITEAKERLIVQATRCGSHAVR